MTNQNEGAFRMRVRVKAGSHNLAAPPLASASTEAGASAGGAKPKSLIEALKQTSTPARNRKTAAAKAAAKRPTKKKSSGKKASETQNTDRAEILAATQSENDDLAASDVTESIVSPTPKQTPRDVISPKSASSGHVAARLKHLERLREATASLELVTSGHIEEATVEIIHYDKPRIAEVAAKD
ncbi:hypothetical protein ACO2I3_18030 [Leptospira interrogans]